MTCPYCAAALDRWWYNGQLWHKIQYTAPVPIPGAQPRTIPTPKHPDIPDRFACAETPIA